MEILLRATEEGKVLESYAAGLGLVREGDAIDAENIVKFLRQLLGDTGAFDMDITAVPVSRCPESQAGLRYTVLSGVVGADDRRTLKDLAVDDGCEPVDGH